MICSAVAEVLLYLNREKSANIQIILAGRDKDRTKKRFYCFEEEKDYVFIQYDATSDNPQNIKADYIIHGASNADPSKFAKEPVETMLANIIGLNILLKSATSNNAKRLLYISSSEVYGRKEEKRPYKEEDYGFVDILNPRASYPSSKRAAETLCAAYSAEYGLDTVIVRPGHIYGPTITDSDSRASAQFTRKAKAGEDIVMKSAGSQLRSYCHTLDCASAIITILINGKKGEAYNISNPNSIVTIREMAEALAKAGNVNIVFENPSDIELNSYNLMDNSSLKSEKLEQLGWRAVYSITEGAQKTLKYFNL
jgi:nucleoside-diphosphate-sugar epimerase